LKIFNLKNILIILVGSFYAIISLEFIPQYSRDFYNIARSIDFTSKNLNIDLLWVLYHIKGNTILLMPFDLLSIFNGYQSAYFIYFTAILLRFVAAFRYLNFKTAIAFIFAFFWMFDWNQSRFSIAFSLFLLLPPKRQLLQLFIHFGLLIRLAYEKIKYVKRFFILTPIVGFFTVAFLKIFFNRYFLPSNDNFPKYSIVYILFFILITLINKNKNVTIKKEEITFGFCTLILFLIFIQAGLSWTYFGRASEIILLISIANYIKNFKNQSLDRNIIFRVCLYTIGLYQLITVNGNVWRLFN